MIAAAKGREGDSQRHAEMELLNSVELLEHAAHTAMAALLLVGSTVFSAILILSGGWHWSWQRRKWR